VGPTISIRAPIAESQAEKASTANGGTERIACSPRSDRGGGHGASQEDAGDGSGYRYRSGMSADASSSSTTKIRCHRVGYDGREGGAVEPQRPHAFGRRSPELMRSLGAGGFGVFRLG
jgi:hypothetical protein